MSQVCLQIGPAWPPSLNAYQYLRGAAMPDWGWEYLRRNPAYQASALVRPNRGLVKVRLSGGTLLTRLRARQASAEAWGLCSFR